MKNDLADPLPFGPWKKALFDEFRTRRRKESDMALTTGLEWDMREINTRELGQRQRIDDSHVWARIWICPDTCDYICQITCSDRILQEGRAVCFGEAVQLIEALYRCVS